MIEVIPIRQEHDKGCGIACLAMVCERDYIDVWKWFHDRGRTEIGSKGMSYTDLFEYLNQHGYCYQRRFGFTICNQPVHPWPPHVFAEAHIMSVPMANTTTDNHFVVADVDGKIIDPQYGRMKDLSLYGTPNYVIGIWRVP